MVFLTRTATVNLNLKSNIKNPQYISEDHIVKNKCHMNVRNTSFLTDYERQRETKQVGCVVK